MDEQDKKTDILDEDIVEATDVTEENEPEMEMRREMETRRTESRPAATKPVREEEEFVPLFENMDGEKFRSQWLDIQSTFIDDPRDSVRKADALVDEVINNITQTFAQRRTSLENQWNSGEDASTEDLRLAIKRYRSFFNRLLSLQS